MSNKNTNEKAPRVTKAMKYDDIIAMLNGNTPKYITAADAIKFIEDEKTLLAKKNASDSKKKKEDVERDKKFAELVENLLADLPSDKPDGMTCTEMWKAIPDFDAVGMGIQKVAHIANVLKEEGRVTSKAVKGQQRFMLA